MHFTALQFPLEHGEDGVALFVLHFRLGKQDTIRRDQPFLAPFQLIHIIQNRRAINADGAGLRLRLLGVGLLGRVFTAGSIIRI